MKNMDKKDIRDLILEELKKQDRPLTFLYRQTKIPYDTLYSSIKLRRFMPSQENINKINEALGTQFSL
jgi:hypothetical protein